MDFEGGDVLDVFGQSLSVIGSGGRFKCIPMDEMIALRGWAARAWI